MAVERRTIERRVKVNRRRQIDPTTCERDYTGDELEFMGALDEYKRTSGRMFPTCSEVLEVLKGLGYEKRPAAESADPGVSPDPTAPQPEHAADAVASDSPCMFSVHAAVDQPPRPETAMPRGLRF